MAWIPLTSLVYITAVAETQTVAESPNAKNANGNTSRRGDVRFEALDIYIDTEDQSLAAYQFELKADSEHVQIVGVEGGSHAAFREPPFYDSAALRLHRIILAALSTDEVLPEGKVRIARVHVQISREIEPKFATELIAAAAPDGTPITSELFVELFVANATGDSL